MVKPSLPLLSQQDECIGRNEEMYFSSHLTDILSNSHFVGVGVVGPVGFCGCVRVCARSHVNASVLEINVLIFFP